MILYVNGCSWSCQSTYEMLTPVYGNFLAEKLGATLINHAVPGSCNNRIIRSTTRNLQNLLKKDKDIICIINITQIYRSEIWLDTESKNYLENLFKGKLTQTEDRIIKQYIDSNDGDFNSFIRNQSGYLVKQLPGFDEYEKYNFLFDHYERQYYELFYNLVLFTTYCRSNNIRYLIFSGINLLDYEKLDCSLPWIQDFRAEVLTDPAILNFDEINFCQWAYNNGYKTYEGNKDSIQPWTGHPDEHAHAAWAEFLYNKLKELYEI